MSSENNYPNMTEDPWKGIVAMPPAVWIEMGLSPDNYMVKSNHEMFEILHDTGMLSDDLYNGTKDTNYIVMTKKYVDMFIKDFQEIVERKKRVLILFKDLKKSVEKK